MLPGAWTVLRLDDLRQRVRRFECGDDSFHLRQQAGGFERLLALTRMGGTSTRFWRCSSACSGPHSGVIRVPRKPSACWRSGRRPFAKRRCTHRAARPVFPRQNTPRVRPGWNRGHPPPRPPSSRRHQPGNRKTGRWNCCRPLRTHRANPAISPTRSRIWRRASWPIMRWKSRTIIG